MSVAICRMASVVEDPDFATAQSGSDLLCLLISVGIYLTRVRERVQRGELDSLLQALA